MSLYDQAPRYQSIDPSFGLKVQQAYDHAKAAGLWANTYSMANAEEYWAEGVQTYFDAKKMVDPPNGIHNAISTRAKLKEYDRDLFSLIDAAFKATAWRPRCPDLGLLPRPGCRLQSETYVVPSESGGERNVASAIPADRLPYIRRDERARDPEQKSREYETGMDQLSSREAMSGRVLLLA